MDRSGDGKVSWREWSAFIRERLPVAHAEHDLRALWLALDPQLSGFVDCSRFRAFMQLGDVAARRRGEVAQGEGGSRRSRVAPEVADREARERALDAREAARANLVEEADKLQHDLAQLKRDEMRLAAARRRVAAESGQGAQTDRGHYRTILENEPECPVAGAHYLGNRDLKDHQRKMLVNRQLSERFTGLGS